MELGIDQLSKVVDALGEGINVFYKVTHGGGIFSVLTLTDEIAALGSVPKGSILEELKDLSASERKVLDARFQAKVSISDKILEQKIKDGELAIEEAVDLVYDGIELYKRGRALVAKFQVLFTN
jgi:hypothetical protein